jgi:hypothetical protein
MRDLNNYLFLYRELLDKPIWTNSTSEQRCVLIAILLRANHSPGEWEWKGERYTVQPGQFITSLQKLAERAGKGVSVQNVRSSIKRFKTLGFITDEPTKTGRLITIINWNVYQPSARATQHSSQQTANKEATPNKNDKKDKNEKKVQPDPLESPQRSIPDGGFPSEEISESSRSKIEQDLIIVANELTSKGKFPGAHSFIQRQRNFRMNPRAILHALNRCLVAIPKNEKWEPWKYCESILKIENGNYNERDATSEHR